MTGNQSKEGLSNLSLNAGTRNIFSGSILNENEEESTYGSPILTGDIIREVRLKDIGARLIVLIISGAAIFLLAKGILYYKSGKMSA